MFQSIGTTELIIIAAVVILLFGGKKIPELFKGIREAIIEFKKSSREGGKSTAKNTAKS